MKSSRMFVCIMLFLSSTVFVGRLIGDVPEPIAHYTFDAGAEDVTGNGFDGTITGDVYFEDGFMYLDGDDDVVDIPSIGTFNEITITMWVNSDVDLEPIQFAGGFNTHNWVTGAVHFKLNYGLLNVGISGFGPDVVGVTPVYPGEWNHIALTVSLTEVALYLNGFLESIVEVTVPQDLIVGDATIGGWNLDREWTGLMDDVRIYDLPLTEEEIIALTTIQPGFNTSVDKETDNIPATFDLSQNYPNPFNPTTTIDYALKTDGTVKLFVYDLTGKEVAVLVDGFQSAGNHKVQFDAANLTSGVYFYKMQAEGQIFTRKMTIIK